VPGTGEVGGGGVGADRHSDGMRAISGGDACSHALAGFDRLSEGRSEARRVLPRHRKEAEVVSALLGDGEADEAAAVAGHEVDGFRCDEVGGQGKVALVLAVLVVNNYNHAPGANLVDCSRNVNERGLGRTRQAHGFAILSPNSEATAKSP